MKRLFIISLLYIFLAGCKENGKAEALKENYPMLDYVTVGKKLDSVSHPYIIHLKNDKKEIVFIGCDHSNNPALKQFSLIEQYFINLKPQIAFNEGGELPDSIHFASMQEAIAQHGETGCLKYLCDTAGIKMVNGDINDSTEFSLTLKKHDKDELFLYYIMERLVIPYLNKAYGDRPFEELYEKAIRVWFVQQGFPLTKEEQGLAYFKKLYQKYLGHPFELKITADIEQFDYINPDCKFCAIGRTSKMVRDSVLLSKIDQSLNTFDRIIITFGAGHALAVEPSLKQIIQKQRGR